MNERVPIRTVSSRVVYKNQWSSYREDIIERIAADGTVSPGLYGVLDKDPSSLVIPLEQTPEGDFVWLVRQFRYTVQGTFFEFPQGGWEMGEDVDKEELARGELREETGLEAERMTRLGDLWIAYGAMRQCHSIFLAEGLRQGETERDEEEHDMTVHRVTVDEFEQMVLDGRVMDNCSVAAWGLYRIWRERRLGASR